MKFMILAKPRAEAPALSDPVAANQAAKEDIKAAMESGLFECAYQFITGGGFAIANADTGEALWAALTAYPLYQQFDWQVKPLVDLGFVFDKSLERLSEAG